MQNNKETENESNDNNEEVPVHIGSKNQSIIYFGVENKKPNEKVGIESDLFALDNQKDPFDVASHPEIAKGQMEIDETGLNSGKDIKINPGSVDTSSSGLKVAIELDPFEENSDFKEIDSQSRMRNERAIDKNEKKNWEETQEWNYTPTLIAQFEEQVNKSTGQTETDPFDSNQDEQIPIKERHTDQVEIDKPEVQLKNNSESKLENTELDKNEACLIKEIEPQFFGQKEIAGLKNEDEKKGCELEKNNSTEIKNGMIWKLEEVKKDDGMQSDSSITNEESIAQETSISGFGLVNSKVLAPPTVTTRILVNKKNLFIKKTLLSNQVTVPLSAQNLFPVSTDEEEQDRKTDTFIDSPKIKPRSEKQNNGSFNLGNNESQFAPKQQKTNLVKPTKLNPFSNVQKMEQGQSDPFAVLPSKGSVFYWTEDGIVVLNNNQKSTNLKVSTTSRFIHEEITTSISVVPEKSQLLLCRHSDSWLHSLMIKIVDCLAEGSSLFLCHESRLSFFLFLLDDVLQKRLSDENLAQIQMGSKTKGGNSLTQINDGLLDFIASLPAKNLIEERENLNVQFKLSNSLNQSASFENYVKFCLKTELYEEVVNNYQDEEITFLVFLRTLLAHRFEFGENALKSLTKRFVECESVQLVCFLLTPELMFSPEGYRTVLKNSSNNGDFELYDFLFGSLKTKQLSLFNDHYSMFLLANMPILISTFNLDKIEFYTKRLVTIANDVSTELFQNLFFSGFVRYYRDFLEIIKKNNIMAFQPVKENVKQGIFGFVNNLLAKGVTKPAPVQETTQKIVYDAQLKRYTLNGKIIEEHKDQMYNPVCVKPQNILPGKLPVPKGTVNLPISIKPEESVQFGLAQENDKLEEQGDNYQIQIGIDAKRLPTATSHLARKNQLAKNRFVVFGQNKANKPE